MRQKDDKRPFVSHQILGVILQIRTNRFPTRNASKTLSRKFWNHPEPRSRYSDSFSSLPSSSLTVEKPVNFREERPRLQFHRGISPFVSNGETLPELWPGTVRTYQPVHVYFIYTYKHIYIYFIQNTYVYMDLYIYGYIYRSMARNGPNLKSK